MGVMLRLEYFAEFKPDMCSNVLKCYRRCAGKFLQIGRKRQYFKCYHPKPGGGRAEAGRGPARAGGAGRSRAGARARGHRRGDEADAGVIPPRLGQIGGPQKNCISRREGVSIKMGRMGNTRRICQSIGQNKFRAPRE